MDKTAQVITTVGNAKQVAVNFILLYGFQILGALIVLTIGFFVSRWVGDLLMKSLMKREMEPPIRSLLVRIGRLLVLVLAAIIALDTAGVKITPLITGLGVAGVGIGLAMQGVLGNLVAGLFIIMAKPFRVGEYVELLGVQGEVMNIELFSTFLLHPDRSRIIIPNRKIIGEILHNFGTMRQTTLTFGVSYDTNLAQAIQLIRDVVMANPRVLKDPAPGIGVAELGASSITISVSPWAAVKDFGALKGELYLAIFDRLNAAKITLPFPQHEIRIVNESLPFAAK
jgi:small conductance mechanosensitive channel